MALAVLRGGQPLAKPGLDAPESVGAKLADGAEQDRAVYHSEARNPYHAGPFQSRCDKIRVAGRNWFVESRNLLPKLSRNLWGQLEIFGVNS